MLVGLPLLCLLLLYGLARNQGATRCDAAMIAAVVWGIFLTAVTELLSLPHWLDPLHLSLSWLAGDLIAGAMWLRTRRASADRILPGGIGERLCIIAAVILITTLGITGAASAPTNWDSMTYHLPRVMHWMADQSVADYPTNCLWQLFQPPWAEFAVLHLQILWGSDRLAFLPQWLAFGGCTAAVFALAGRLGGGRAGKTLAVVFAISLPTALLQAASTQNNLVVAFWLLCFANGVVRCGTRDARYNGIFTGGALGLALLTKGTTYVIAPPILLVLTVGQLRQGRRGIARLLVIGIIAVAINTGLWTRNIRTFGSPLTPASEREYQVQAMSPRLWLSNVIRNLSLHAATPGKGVNNAIVQTVDRFEALIGADPADPRITSPGVTFFLRPPHNDEDLTGAPLHLIILLGVGVAMIPTRRVDGRLILFYLLPIISFGLFCAVLKWQAFHARLHLPIFMLAAAPVGCLLERDVNRRARRGRGIVAVLMLLAFITVFQNPGHPWFGRRSIFTTQREMQYFINRPDLYAPYTAAANLASAHASGTIGFIGGPNDWEYPVWIQLHNRLGRWPAMHSITGPITPVSIANCSAVICVTSDPPPAGWLRTDCGKSVSIWLPSF